MAKPFADDGAAGASGIPDADASPSFGGGSGGGSTPTLQTGNISDAQAIDQFGPGALANGALNGVGGNFSQGPAPTTSASDVPAGWTNTIGTFFEQGGGVPDDSGSGADGSDPMSSALNTVDQVLQFGYSKYGLGGQQDQGGGIQEANASYSNGRMPAVPGSQSNSGVPPLQPQPGPLPPTSNPFGKRAEGAGPADDDNDGSA